MSKQYPEKWVGQLITIQTKMVNQQGNVALQGKLLSQDEDSIMILARNKDGSEQEMHFTRDEIRFTIRACEAAVKIAGADQLGALAAFNGRRN